MDHLLTCQLALSVHEADGVPLDAAGGAALDPEIWRHQIPPSNKHARGRSGPAGCCTCVCRIILLQSCQTLDVLTLAACGHIMLLSEASSTVTASPQLALGLRPSPSQVPGVMH